MAVCGHCFLCGSKLDCGGRVRCASCASATEDKPGTLACPRCDTAHEICAGCLDAMHGLGGLSQQEKEVLVAILARLGSGR